MVAFKVDTVGTIKVWWLVGEDKSPTGILRPYHIVTFDGSKFGTGKHKVKAYATRIDRGMTLLYNVVCDAMSSVDMDANAPIDITPWIACAEIPVGTVRVNRHRYHVTSNGCHSYPTDGTHRGRDIKVTRTYDETPLESLMRCVRDWSGWDDAGTFDSICTDDARWSTVPVEGHQVRMPDGQPGIPCVEHSITFTGGDILCWLEHMKRQAVRDGVAWA
jgi:hypothetical protein